MPMLVSLALVLLLGVYQPPLVERMVMDAVNSLNNEMVANP